MKKNKIMLAGLGLLLSLTACGGSGSGSLEDLNPQTQLIINEYSAPKPELTLAYNRLVGQCMQAAGFTPRSSYLQEQGHNLTGLKGVFPSQEGARQGYSTTIQQDTSGEMTPEESLAYYGSQNSPMVSVELSQGVVVSRRSEGCAAQAYTRIYGSVENSLTYENFINELLGAGKENSGKKAIESAEKELENYITCLQGATGLETHSLEETGQLVASKLGAYRQAGQAPSQQELDYALADYRCQQESGYVQAVNQAYLGYISDWLISHEDLVLKIRDIEQTAHESVQEVLKG